MQVMEIETNVFVDAAHAHARPEYTHKCKAFFKVGSDAQFYQEAEGHNAMLNRVIWTLGRSKEECEEVLDEVHALPDLHLVDSVTGLIDEVM